jgi:hypothetical protein
MAGRCIAAARCSTPTPWARRRWWRGSRAYGDRMGAGFSISPLLLKLAAEGGRLQDVKNG